jgi:anti-sigma regulatory factor (Ser/Thr protein kinase)
MGGRESNSLVITLGGEDAVHAATAAARSFAAEFGLGHDDTARLCIVIEELVTNLYEHGGVSGGDRVKLAFASEPGGVRIVLDDPGIAFDPRGTASGAVPDRGGGAGVNLVRAWTQILDYRSIGGVNTLSLLLPLRG